MIKNSLTRLNAYRAKSTRIGEGLNNLSCQLFISKEGTKRPFLLLRTSRTGAVSDPITKQPALIA